TGPVGTRSTNPADVLSVSMIADLQNAYINAVERVGASTVNVSTAGAAYGPPFGRPWPRRGFGSGVLLDAEGHVLTTHHVIDGASKVIVTFADGRVLSGAVVGGDDETDIAIIKVDGKDFQAAEFADSDQLKVGQPALAIGNPLGLPGAPTATSAVISSLRRNLSLGPGAGLPVTQTAAAVTPGPSACPLVAWPGRPFGESVDIQAERRGHARPVTGNGGSRPVWAPAVQAGSAMGGPMRPLHAEAWPAGGKPTGKWYSMTARGWVECANCGLKDS